MTFCLKAELVFAETRCHLIDDWGALPPWGGLLSGSREPDFSTGGKAFTSVAIHCGLATVYRT